MSCYGDRWKKLNLKNGFLPIGITKKQRFSNILQVLIPGFCGNRSISANHDCIYLPSAFDPSFLGNELSYGRVNGVFWVYAESIICSWNYGLCGDCKIVRLPLPFV